MQIVRKDKLDLIAEQDIKLSEIELKYTTLLRKYGVALTQLRVTQQANTRMLAWFKNRKENLPRRTR